MLQIEEDTETNNQAELATSTNESQHKSARRRTNPICNSYKSKAPVTRWSRKDDTKIS